jgi:two-component system OmpR family response regulator
MNADVVVLRWPDQADEADRLASLGRPRLLVVEPGVAPPRDASCLVDWLRLPADDEDVRARVAALAARAARHPTVPVADDHGQVSHEGTTVSLPSIEERVAKVLIENFGHPVRAEELISCVWAEDGSNLALRVHISRLRHRLAPLGVAIKSIRGFGYVMRHAESAAS